MRLFGPQPIPVKQNPRFTGKFLYKKPRGQVACAVLLCVVIFIAGRSVFLGIFRGFGIRALFAVGGKPAILSVRVLEQQIAQRKEQRQADQQDTCDERLEKTEYDSAGLYKQPYSRKQQEKYSRQVKLFFFVVLFHTAEHELKAQVDKCEYDRISHGGDDLPEVFNDPFCEDGHERQEEQKEHIPPAECDGDLVDAVKQPVMRVPEKTDDKKTDKKHEHGHQQRENVVKFKMVGQRNI